MLLAKTLKLVADCPHCNDTLRPKKQNGTTFCSKCQQPIKRKFVARSAIIGGLLGAMGVVIGSLLASAQLNIATLIGAAIGIGIVSGFRYVKED